MPTLISAILFFIVFGCILFLAYVTTRFIGNKGSRNMKGRYINIIETVSLGIDSKLHVIKIGEEYVLISSSGKNIQLIKSVQLDKEFIRSDVSNNEVSGFKDIFDKYIGGFIKTTEKTENIKTTERASSIDKNHSIKNNLNRLREITAGIGRQYKNGDENVNEKNI